MIAGDQPPAAFRPGEHRGPALIHHANLSGLLDERGIQQRPADALVLRGRRGRPLEIPGDGGEQAEHGDGDEERAEFHSETNGGGKRQAISVKLKAEG